MAASNLNLGKASGGVLNIQPADGTTTTSIVLPASGNVTTNEYVNSSNLGNGSTTFNGFGGTGFKNYIINGDMRIAQRGSGPFTTTGYGIDRWFSYISTTNSSITRIWIGTGSNHPSYAQVAVGAGTDTVTMEQRVEYPHQFGGKTLTLSMFLFNGTYTGTNVPCEIALNHAGGRTILFSGNLTFSLSRVSVTFTVPDLSSYTLNSNSYLEIRPVNIINRGYTGVFGIKDVQLEAGSVATPFEQRPYGLEMSLCQRYFEASNLYIIGNTIINGYVGGTVSFNTRKRVTPTITVNNIFENSGNNNGLQINSACESSFRVYTSNTANDAQCIMSARYYADAEL